MKNKKFFVGIKGVIEKDGKVLLIKASQQVEGRDHWEVPGGRIDADETVEEALLRELLEEVPNIMNIKVHKILHAYRVQRDVKDDTSLVLIFYKVTADFDGEPRLSGEHTEYKWLNIDEACKLASPPVAKAISIRRELRTFATSA